MRFGISATSSILPKNLRTRLRPVNVCAIVASLLVRAPPSAAESSGGPHWPRPEAETGRAEGILSAFLDRSRPRAKLMGSWEFGARNALLRCTISDQSKPYIGVRSSTTTTGMAGIGHPFGPRPFAGARRLLSGPHRSCAFPPLRGAKQEFDPA